MLPFLFISLRKIFFSSLTCIILVIQVKMFGKQLPVAVYNIQSLYTCLVSFYLLMIKHSFWRDNSWSNVNKKQFDFNLVNSSDMVTETILQYYHLYKNHITLISTWFWLTSRIILCYLYFQYNSPLIRILKLHVGIWGDLEI